MQKEYKDLVNEVFRLIGINIILLQKIEKQIKFITPFIEDPKDPEPTADSIVKKKEKIKLHTLGALINNFIKASDFSKAKIFSELMQKIVEERNQLVHNFGGSEGLNILSTEEGCRKCIERLESQRKEVYFIYEELQLYTLSMIYLFRQIYGDSHPEFHLIYDRLKTTAIKRGVEYINLFDSSETAWENTKIVKLLRLAETETEQVDGMTLLSKAGKFIKENDPECIPKKYGVKALKNILQVSKLFEIVERDEAGILYRSKTTDK